MRFAASRALPSVGSRMEISSAMMPMTTSSSTSVKPPRGGGVVVVERGFLVVGDTSVRSRIWKVAVPHQKPLLYREHRPTFPQRARHDRDVAARLAVEGLVQ